MLIRRIGGRTGDGVEWLMVVYGLGVIAAMVAASTAPAWMPHVVSSISRHEERTEESLRQAQGDMYTAFKAMPQTH